jgi:hypothetical protein
MAKKRKKNGKGGGYITDLIPFTRTLLDRR